MNQKQTTTLIILDGFGHREETENNAIALAHTPHIDRPRDLSRVQDWTSACRQDKWATLRLVT